MGLVEGGGGGGGVKGVKSRRTAEPAPDSRQLLTLLRSFYAEIWNLLKGIENRFYAGAEAACAHPEFVLKTPPPSCRVTQRAKDASVMLMTLHVGGQGGGGSTSR